MGDMITIKITAVIWEGHYMRDQIAFDVAGIDTQPGWGCPNGCDFCTTDAGELSIKYTCNSCGNEGVEDEEVRNCPDCNKFWAKDGLACPDCQDLVEETQVFDCPMCQEEVSVITWHTHECSL